ncbi:MAG: DUF366 family protein [Bdellovibrionales bacterium]|nr:DUF366 family protein [Bdellovibrionales bacterium]
MEFKYIGTELAYDGSQLRSLYAYMNHKLLGDSLIAWVGSCNISKEEMVDGEDLIAEQEIRGDLMLHFIAEIFDRDLFSGVCLQRLFADICMSTLKELSPEKEVAHQLSRAGDDIYFQDRKLSISVATRSPLSTLFHFAVNIVNEGTPVKTLCLNELKVDARDFGQQLGSKFCMEYQHILTATKKVRWVK